MRFAKIQCMVQLSESPKKFIWLGQVKQKLEYLDRPQFCQECKGIGHSKEKCTADQAPRVAGKLNPVARKEIEIQEDIEEGEWLPVKTKNPNPHAKGEKGRQYWKKKSAVHSTFGNIKNPFNVLLEVNESNADTWYRPMEKIQNQAQPLDLILFNLNHPKNISNPTNSSQPFCPPPSQTYPTFAPYSETEPKPSQKP